MAVPENLTNTCWFIKATPSIFTSVYASINFTTAGGSTHSYFGVNSTNGTITYGSREVYTSTDGWISEPLRTIYITGGSAVTQSALRTWLGKNATQLSTYTVTFNANGHGTAPSPITGVISGSTITEPTAPTETGYIFGGWYKEQACTNVWNFSTDTVTQDTTLWAKWTEEKKLYVGVNNQSSKITKGYVGVGSQSRKITHAYIGVNNEAKKIF